MIANSVARKNRASIARQVMKDRKIKAEVLQILARHAQKEMAAMCSKKRPSLLRGAEAEDFLSFSWNKLGEEAKSIYISPTLHQLLRGLVDVKRIELVTPTDIGHQTLLLLECV